jgi:hypothetical protein
MCACVILFVSVLICMIASSCYHFIIACYHQKMGFSKIHGNHRVKTCIRQTWDIPSGCPFWRHLQILLCIELFIRQLS